MRIYAAALHAFYKETDQPLMCAVTFLDENLDQANVTAILLCKETYPLLVDHGVSVCDVTDAQLAKCGYVKHDETNVFQVRVEIDQQELYDGTIEQMIKKAFKDGYQRCQDDYKDKYNDDLR